MLATMALEKTLVRFTLVEVYHHSFFRFDFCALHEGPDISHKKE